MTEYGIKADYKHDYSESGKYQPRHLATFAERGNANGVIGVQDPFWVVSGPSGDATTDGFVKIGIADGTGSWPDIGAATYIKLENGKVTSRGNLDFGAFYADMAQISVPANPAANTRRLFVDSATGKLSVRTNAGVTISLEETGAGGGTVGGTGTAGTITKWAAGGADIEDSIITESGTAVTIGGSLTVNTIVAGVADYDKFLVSHAGLIKFRTGAEAYSDMDGYVTADFTTDFAAESLANLTTRTHASLSDAPENAHHNKNHALIDSTGHTVSGLTGGHFLKALTATTYGFQAHGLGASDVGAYTTAQTDSAIDTDITTHAAIATAHQDAPGLIATHAAIATAHQDAPALIATHAADDDAHHAVYTNAMAVSAVQAANPLALTYDLTVAGGDVTIGSTSLAENADVLILAADGYEARLSLYGGSQGSGVIFVGQSATYGGGMLYNGDGTPAHAGSGANDSVSFYRTAVGVHYPVFHYMYNSDNVIFQGDVTVANLVTSGNVDGVDVSAHDGGDVETYHTNFFTNADAVSAVVAQNPLNLTNDLQVSGGNIGIGIAPDPTYVIETLDADAYARFGRARIGHSNYLDAATLTHRDLTGAGTYGFLQTAAGRTDINALTGQAVNLKIQGVIIGSFDASGFRLHASTTRIADFSIDGTLSANSDTRVPTEKAIKTYVDAAAGGPGTGTQWKLPVWATTTTLGDSMISQDSGGTLATVGGALTVSGAFKAGGDGFDVDASGNITDVTMAAATVDTDKFVVQDGSQLKTRTGVQVLSDIGAGGTQKVGPTFPPYLQNGAVWSASNQQAILAMPDSDNDCMARMSFRVPDEWPTGACDLKIMYAIPGTTAYSVQWYISATEEGDNRVATNANVLNASTAYDFPAGASNTVYVRTIALSDVDIVPGCSLGVRVNSDALNTTTLYIMEMWIEP